MEDMIGIILVLIIIMGVVFGASINVYHQSTLDYQYKIAQLKCNK